MNETAKQVWEYITKNQDQSNMLVAASIKSATGVDIEIAKKAIFMWAIGDHEWFNKTFTPHVTAQ